MSVGSLVSHQLIEFTITTAFRNSFICLDVFIGRRQNVTMRLLHLKEKKKILGFLLWFAKAKEFSGVT